MLFFFLHRGLEGCVVRGRGSAGESSRVEWSPGLSVEAHTEPYPPSSHPLIVSICSSTVTEHLVARGFGPSLCIFCFERCSPLGAARWGSRSHAARPVPRFEAGGWKDLDQPQLLLPSPSPLYQRVLLGQ